MKLVREHINEKFSEKSDPIEDLEIGFPLIKDVAKQTRQQAATAVEFLLKNKKVKNIRAQNYFFNDILIINFSIGGLTYTLYYLTGNQEMGVDDVSPTNWTLAQSYKRLAYGVNFKEIQKELNKLFGSKTE